MKRCLCLFALSFLAAPLAAQAQDESQIYLRAGAGVNLMQHEREDARLTPAAATESLGDVTLSPGPAVAGAFGIPLRRNWWFEIEGSLRSNHVRRESGLGSESLGAAAERKYGVMANVLYDRVRRGVRPYVGAGIGAQFIDEPSTVTSSGGVTVSLTGGVKGALAYQLIGGAAIPITYGMYFTAEYRYLGLAGTRTYTGTATIPGLGSFDLQDSSSHDANHAVLFGIRCAFGG